MNSQLKNSLINYYTLTQTPLLESVSNGSYSAIIQQGSGQGVYFSISNDLVICSSDMIFSSTSNGCSRKLNKI